MIRVALRVREALPGADQLFRLAVEAGRDDQPVAGEPGTDCGILRLEAAHRRVDPVCGLAQRDLPQRRQVLLAEEPLRRGGDAIRRVDLARPQSVEQIFGR